MDIRVMGTEEECAAFAKMVRETVPEKRIRQISHWYPNRRKGEFSTEGRIYISFRDIVIFPSNALPEPEKAEEKEEIPKEGTCAYCGAENQKLMILGWDGHQYRGACTDCAKKYIDQQTIGMLLEVENPELYKELWRKSHPKLMGFYMDANGGFPIWGAEGDEWPEPEGQGEDYS